MLSNESMRKTEPRGRRLRENRNRGSSKPSSLNKPRMKTTHVPIPMWIKPLRGSIFGKVLRVSFFPVLIIWYVIVFQIYMTTTIDSNFAKIQNGPLPPMLIVGGSDGSGTRAIVEILRELGTVIVSEDKGTFDVHAGEIFEGWPGLIKRIFLPFGRKGFFSMEERQSPKIDSNTSTPSAQSLLVAQYDWPPQNMNYNGSYGKDKRRVEADVRKLLRTWDSKYSRQITQTRRDKERLLSIESLTKNAAKQTFSGFGIGRRGPSVKIYPDAVANNVTYAIKAPISMLALPVFITSHLSFRQETHHPTRPLKFLHVIRDGRDVALSDNQSPANKFYDLTYPRQIRDNKSLQSKFSNSSLKKENPDQTYARAMQLWNDWNLVVHRWATNHNINNWRARSKSNDDVPSVDYLWVRSEDLLVPGSQKRLDALTVMAKFVGSSLTPEELCCLSRQDNKDHGQSHVTKYDTATKTHSKSVYQRRPNTVNAMTSTEFIRDYEAWKSFVDSALLAENGKIIQVDYLIRRGQELLNIQREQHSHNKTLDKLPNEVETLDAIQKLKLKLKFGHRRLLMMKRQEQRYRGPNGIFTSIIQNQSTGLSEHPIITKRYGKWQKVLESKPELSDFFHREGAEGLQVFGYHPYRRMNYKEQHVGYPRDGYNSTELQERMSEEIRNNKSTIDDEEEEGNISAPGICVVSIACP